jgi:hypothetical protein
MKPIRVTILCLALTFSSPLSNAAPHIFLPHAKPFITQ